jgi:hypothetical protein
MSLQGACTHACRFSGFSWACTRSGLPVYGEKTHVLDGPDNDYVCTVVRNSRMTSHTKSKQALKCFTCRSCLLGTALSVISIKKDKVLSISAHSLTPSAFPLQTKHACKVHTHMYTRHSFYGTPSSLPVASSKKLHVMTQKAPCYDT